MEPRSSLLCLEQHATSPNPKPDEYSPHPPKFYLKSILVLSSHLCLDIPNGLFPQVFQPKPFLHVSSMPCILRASPMSFSFIKIPA